MTYEHSVQRIACEKCGHESQIMKSDWLDRPPLEGDGVTCGKCGARYVIVPDGLMPEEQWKARALR